MLRCCVHGALTILRGQSREMWIGLPLGQIGRDGGCGERVAKVCFLRCRVGSKVGNVRMVEFQVYVREVAGNVESCLDGNCNEGCAFGVN